MTPGRSAASQQFDRWGHLAVGVVLIMAFVSGGDSVRNGVWDVITQLLALPLGIWATLVARSASGFLLRRHAATVLLLILAALVIQQLPLPANLWTSIPARQALAIDLRVAAVEHPRYAWSLSPLASERALWAVLPALAVFIGSLALPARQLRRMLLLVVFLSGFSMLLGGLQMGLAQNSALNPFPQWSPAFNGLFANPNHQGIAAAVSIIIVAALLMSDPNRGIGRGARWGRQGLTALAILQFAMLPLTGSRAAFVLAATGVIVLPLLLRTGRRPESAAPVLARRSTHVVLGLSALVVVIFMIMWLRLNSADQVRWSLIGVTAAMGWEHAPLGAGTGTFAPWFDQVAPIELIQWEFFNHAHNEYVQWWFECGLIGVACMLGVIGLLGGHCRALATQANSGDRGVAVAAWLGCVVLLLHSVVDYPLRTPALMTVAGLLAGIVFAQRKPHDGGVGVAAGIPGTKVHREGGVG